MDKHLETLIGNFISEIEGYEQRTGCFVELWRSDTSPEGKLRVEVKKSFGNCESDNQDKAA